MSNRPTKKDLSQDNQSLTSSDTHLTLLQLVERVEEMIDKGDYIKLENLILGQNLLKIELNLKDLYIAGSGVKMSKIKNKMKEGGVLGS